MPSSLILVSVISCPFLSLCTLSALVLAIAAAPRTASIFTSSLAVTAAFEGGIKFLESAHLFPFPWAISMCAFVSANLHNSRGPDASSCASLQYFTTTFSKGAGMGAGLMHGIRRRLLEVLLCAIGHLQLLSLSMLFTSKIQSGFSKMVQPCRAELPTNQLSNSLEVRML